MAKKSLKEKRKKVQALIEAMSESRLDDLLNYLYPQDSDLYVSEDDWAEVEYRSKQVREGKVKEIPARDVLKKMKAALKKKRE